MKKIVIILICLISVSSYAQLNNDLLLVKPLVNFNDSTGGFYSDYFEDDLNQIYCGAVIQNIGGDTATNVFLEINYIDQSNNILSTHFSDTISSLNPNEFDTINFSTLAPYNLWKFRIIYQVKSDSIDESGANNIDTIPTTHMYSNFWSFCSRANVPNDTLDINNVNGFQSGDFMGITLKSLSQGHIMASAQVYMMSWPATLRSITVKIYENGSLKDSIEIPNTYSGFPSGFPTWCHGTYHTLPNGVYIYPDSTYYVGVELDYDSGTQVPIGIDTSAFHNFEYETVSRIGGVWSTLDFVPLIQLVFDPEGIEEFTNDIQITTFPNPTTNQLMIESDAVINKIKVIDAFGKTVVTHGVNTKEIDVSNLIPGTYLLQFETDQGTTTKKFVKQ